MRNIQLLLLCCFFSIPVFGQFTYGEYFINYDTLTCPFDSSKTVVYPEGWVIYQTTDGTWEGPADSARCISAEPFGSFGQARIALAQIDKDKPLFLRTEVPDLSGANTLEPNYLYNAFAYSHVSSQLAKPVTGSDCVQDLCSGLFIGISIPGTTRFQTGLFPQTIPSETYQYLAACFPTEYFNTQHLKDLILKYTFQPAMNLNGQYLYLEEVSIIPAFTPPGLISEISADADNYNFSSDEYDVNVAEAVTGGGFFYENFLLQYTAPTFPSAQNPSYVIGTVTPNPPEQQVINLVVSSFQTLEIQPFTYLVGALAQGSDTLRHQVNLLNNGGDICLNFVDFVMDGGEEYRHGGGTMSFNNAFSCMQFRNGSALRVLEGASLHYGGDGAGMLALCAGGTIALERNAGLTIDCTLNLAECNEALPPQQIYMDLPPGARLIFTGKARLTNRFSQGQQMLLNVRMLGGSIDDTALAPEDQALIRRIYPQPALHMEDNVTVAPNPFGETFTLTYIAGKTEKMTLRWANTSGQIVREEHFQAALGLNEWVPGTPEEGGVYLLTLETEAGKTTKKVVKLSR